MIHYTKSVNTDRVGIPVTDGTFMVYPPFKQFALYVSHFGKTLLGSSWEARKMLSVCLVRSSGNESVFLRDILHQIRWSPRKASERQEHWMTRGEGIKAIQSRQL
jgi:hypothetical protein